MGFQRQCFLQDVLPQDLKGAMVSSAYSHHWQFGDKGSEVGGVPCVVEVVLLRWSELRLVQARKGVSVKA